jgi:peptidoglycan/LPS O-acetylase OafA/YrhL
MEQNENLEDAAAPSKTDATLPKPVEKLWAAHGVEDVYFQREAQVTWWTILGGIAVGALLTRLESIPEAFKAGQWYVLLYLLATLLVIINSWVQTTWGSLVLRWPLSIPTAVFISFQGIAMSVAGLNAFKPAVWYAAISFVLITAVLNQVSFSKTHARENLPEELERRAQTGIRIYWFLSGFAVGSSILLALVTNQTLQMIWGFVALAGSILALVWQHLGMKEEKRKMGIP